MIFLCSTAPLLSIKPQFLKPLPPIQRIKINHKRNLKCKAEFAQDAPFAVAIGASILNSLVFPIPRTPDEDSGAAIDSTDARFAVMGIISFIPYFNWLSWVFAFLDTSSPRYVVYSIIYLAPYIRTNLSLSPEESWLPIASIFLCIIHIQIEASIRNGDLQAFQLFKEAGSNVEDRKAISEKGRKYEQKLPSSQEHSRNELHGWGAPEKRAEQSDENEDADK